MDFDTRVSYIFSSFPHELIRYIDEFVPENHPKRNISINRIENKASAYYFYINGYDDITLKYLINNEKDFKYKFTERYNDIYKDYSTTLLDINFVYNMIKVIIEINNITPALKKLNGFLIINYLRDIIIYTYYINRESVNSSNVHEIIEDNYGLLIPQLKDIGELTKNIEKFPNGFKLTIFLFQFKEPIDYYNKIILTNLYDKMDPLGGLSKSQILASPFVFLMHETYYNSLELILGPKKLYTKPELAEKSLSVYGGIFSDPSEKTELEKTIKKTTQYPGVYTRLVAQKHIYTGTHYPTLQMYSASENFKIRIILSLSLLRLHNWHWNKEDLYGAITDYTFVPETMAHYLPNILKLWPSKSPFVTLLAVDNELVFHDGIPVNFIECLLVGDYAQKERIEELIKKYNVNIPVYVESKELLNDLATRQALKYIDSDISDLNKLPQLCHINKVGDGLVNYNQDYHIPYKEPSEYQSKMDIDPKYDINIQNQYIYSKMLKNCGLPQNGTLDDIEEKMEDIYFGSKKRVIVGGEDLPPFKYTPEYYGITKYLP